MPWKRSKNEPQDTRPGATSEPTAALTGGEADHAERRRQARALFRAAAGGVERRGATLTGSEALGAGSAGAVAIGALALGAVAIGAFAIGRLSVGRARVGRLEMKDADIDRLRIGLLEIDTIVPPRRRFHL
ncbi:hypothetical protein [Jiella marina]|uniref:hypothetical protein n=1 Tax=Jiella sp. LLJ827 TaxID=2917712 RepID=UPI0021016ACE|nr:hypothetical protein [Jiella sp. LLJ827]MCQ0986766.1 hypothetical protein [Jiella sp. LLJ827]